MCSKGLFRRILPFFATFVIGLFIASFFVDISAPRFGRGRFARQEIQRIQIENQQQREELRQKDEEIRQLHEQLDGRRMKSSTLDSRDFDEIPMDVRVPLPPPPPRVRR